MFGNGYSKYYDLLNQDKPYKKEIEFIYKWAGKPKWIFDIGCGRADYWKFYPRKCVVFGIDKSSAMAKGNKNIIHGDITKYKYNSKKYFLPDCATAIFDVLNYIPEHSWWPKIPVKKGGHWVFDIWDKEKVDRDGFRRTTRQVGNLTRTIIPLGYDGKRVMLRIEVFDGKDTHREDHEMFVWSESRSRSDSTSRRSASTSTGSPTQRPKQDNAASRLPRGDSGS